MPLDANKVNRIRVNISRAYLNRTAPVTFVFRQGEPKMVDAVWKWVNRIDREISPDPALTVAGTLTVPRATEAMINVSTDLISVRAVERTIHIIPPNQQEGVDVSTLQGPYLIIGWQLKGTAFPYNRVFIFCRRA